MGTYLATYLGEVQVYCVNRSYPHNYGYNTHTPLSEVSRISYVNPENG